jgi:hypothetical protein
MEERSVDDILRLVDGLRDRGVTRFQGSGMTVEIGRTPKPRRTKVTPDVTPANAVDLALSLNEKKNVDDVE